MEKIKIEHDNEFEGGHGVESFWATPLGNGFYRVENVLFYAKGYSFGDIVRVEERPDDGLYVVALVEESGHSTVRIIFMNTEEVQAVRRHLETLGCESEMSDRPYLISVDIPKAVDYKIVRAYLEEGKSKEEWFFEEAVLAHPL